MIPSIFMTYLFLYPLLENRYPNVLKKTFYPSMPGSKNENGFNLLSQLLEYDPYRRITAEDALNHPYFQESPKPSFKYVNFNAFFLGCMFYFLPI